VPAVRLSKQLGRNKDGRLQAFVRGTDPGLWHRWQTAANNGWI